MIESDILTAEYTGDKCCQVGLPERASVFRITQVEIVGGEERLMLRVEPLCLVEESLEGGISLARRRFGLGDDVESLLIRALGECFEDLDSLEYASLV